MAVALEKIPDAIYAWFAGDQGAGSVYAAVSGRLYYTGSVPENTAWPFIVFQRISSAPDWAQGLNNETGRFQFTIFTADDPDGGAAEAIASKLRNRFDWATLTFTGNEYSTVSMRPDVATGPLPANPGETDKRSMFTQDYFFWIREAG